MDGSPVYMIVLLDVKDMQSFMADYAGLLQPIHARHGVETLVATPTPEVLEGTYKKSITVVLKFPSAEAQRAWYADPDYQPLLKRRFELTHVGTSVALVAPQFGADTPPSEGKN